MKRPEDDLVSAAECAYWTRQDDKLLAEYYREWSKLEWQRIQEAKHLIARARRLVRKRPGQSKAKSPNLVLANSPVGQLKPPPTWLNT